MSATHLDPRLKNTVKLVVALFGQIIRRHAGRKFYAFIERTRADMTLLREADHEDKVIALRRLRSRLAKMSPVQRAQFTRSYALMLEIMNACENAYRSFILESRHPALCSERPEAIIYVLTAHPTEARSPENVAAFGALERAIVRILKDSDFEKYRNTLGTILESLWRLPLARQRRPRVEDEAEYIYSIALNDEILGELLEITGDTADVFLRSWVGGDKDGHPGVDQFTMANSLALSRHRLIKFMLKRLAEVSRHCALLKESSLRRKAKALEKDARRLRHLTRGDGARVRVFRKSLIRFANAYSKAAGVCHPALDQLCRLSRMFPAYAIPLEIRESSEMIMKTTTRSAVVGMLKTLRQISSGGEPRWYVRGFIISMCESIEHVRAAMKIVAQELGSLKIPVIPLFENQKALVDSVKIVKQMLNDRHYKKGLQEHWDRHFEVMVGYSDSSKEMGVLQSRVLLADVIQKLDRLFSKHRVTPVFFHGSGGSVDRGGGSIQEQTAWWPKSSLRLYKATIQGEMVERSLSTPAIARSLIERIVLQGCQHRDQDRSRGRHSIPVAVKRFATKASAQYETMIHDPNFLTMVEQATPYRYLKALRIGSRPTKRGTELSLKALRAIPWILCWTQTRVLFPTWWGVGTAWTSLTPAEKRELRTAFETNELFRSFVKLLGFTLAKVELPVFQIYLEDRLKSPGPVIDDFRREFENACRFVRALTGKRDLLWFRPWLGESITLRSPMIHPLNLVQLEALKNNDGQLIRETVTGIANGMLTTG